MMLGTVLAGSLTDRGVFIAVLVAMLLFSLAWAVGSFLAECHKAAQQPDPAKVAEDFAAWERELAR